MSWDLCFLICRQCKLLFTLLSQMLHSFGCWTNDQCHSYVDYLLLWFCCFYFLSCSVMFIFSVIFILSMYSPWIDNHDCIYWFKVQALVGFEKTIKHLDDHLVEIGSKVDFIYLQRLKLISFFDFWLSGKKSLCKFVIVLCLAIRES